MKFLIPIWLVIMTVTPALAEVSTPCTATPDMLGVSRVAEIDTTGGRTFGQQYPPEHLLQPGEVVLTFDDGPFPVYTEAILAALAAQCTKATFFNVGSMASNFPKIAQEVLQAGHTIGTHTWSHANLAGLSPAAGKAQIERAIETENKILDGSLAPFFRFPYLSDSKHMRAYLGSRNIAVFSVDVDSLDYRAKTADQVVRNVMAGLTKTGGGIILFHDIHAVTAKALPTILTSLKAKNFKIVHLIPRTALQPVALLGHSSQDDKQAKITHRHRVAQRRDADPIY